MKAIDLNSFDQGFTFTERGRSGEIYYRSGDRLMELYWEMSGVDDYDILLWLEGTKVWLFPKEERVEEGDLQKIVDSLQVWLNLKKIRADAFDVVKRPCW